MGVLIYAVWVNVTGGVTSGADWGPLWTLGGYEAVVEILLWVGAGVAAVLETRPHRQAARKIRRGLK